MIDDCNCHNEDSFQYKISFCDRAIISIRHQNVRSIVNKYDDFVKMIGLTETWLKKYNIDEYLIQEYKFVGQTRNSRRRGRVGMYVNKLHQLTERTDLSINIENIIEAQLIS